MATFVVFVKRAPAAQGSTLTVKCFEQQHFAKVQGMAEFTAKETGLGFKYVAEGETETEAIASAIVDHDYEAGLIF